MIQCIQWPPVHYCTYSLLGRRFEQEPDAPFVVYMRDGTVDTDLTRQTPGFINRIQRYGIQNKVDRQAWTEENIFYSLLPKLPLELRGKFFRITPYASPSPQMSVTPHTAPVPAGLAAAAGFPSAAENDPDLAAKLATLSPEKWLGALKRWVAADPARRTETAAGPAWWWAIHSVALNPVATSTPANFVGVWLGLFPCRKCRIGGRIDIARNPVPGWESFAQWASDIHNDVTSIK